MGRFGFAILIRGLSLEPRAFSVYRSATAFGLDFSLVCDSIENVKQELC